MVDISKSTEFYQNQEQQSCAAKLCSKATFSVQKFMEINLNPGFFLPASEYFRRHKDVQKRHSGSLSPLLEALTSVLKSGALAQKWRFWTSLWRQKFLGAGRFQLDFRLFGRKILGKDFNKKKFQFLVTVEKIVT